MDKYWKNDRERLKTKRPAVSQAFKHIVSYNYFVYTLLRGSFVETASFLNGKQNHREMKKAENLEFSRFPALLLRA